MSFYIYETEDGEVEEREFPLGEAPATVTINGKVARKHFAYQTSSRREPWGTTPGGYPKVSWSIGVHPSQAKELHDKLHDAGVPTQITTGGDAVITSLDHQRKVQKALGLHDRAGWY